jgi:4-amino-4-deoxy-L-arabinose transferase-like glycosyltransferase
LKSISSILYNQQNGAGWAIGVGAAGAAAVLILVIASKKEKLTHIAAIAGLLALLVAPLYWAATPLLYGGNSMLPEASPSLKQSSGMGGGSHIGGSGEVNTKLLDYVTKNNTGEKYLFGVSRATEASSYIIQTGKAVMAMGGFSGSDRILTVDKLKQMVQNKEIKYFLLSSGGFGGGEVSSDITTWIKEHSTEVTKSEYQSETTQTG